MEINLLVVLILCFVTLARAYLSIDDYGAKPNDTSYEAALINGIAYSKAMIAANTGPDRGVIIPNSVYYMLPTGGVAGMESLVDVELVLLGRVLAWSQDLKKWPVVDGTYLVLFQFTNCTGLRLSGTGTIDGQGYGWWWDNLLGGKGRPQSLVQFSMCINLDLRDWSLFNSMQYHINIIDSKDVFVTNITVYVDVFKQQELYKTFGIFVPTDNSVSTDPIPSLPLNTDGIDVSGQNITVTNCRIQNFNDAICLKSLNADNVLSNCTSNVVFDGIDIHLSTGAATGTVSPGIPTNCIRNCTFRNINFDSALKAVYVKPDYGNIGYGIIDSIVYENIFANNTLWWSIWVSLQQESDKHDCSFLFPWVDHCPTQPRVPVTNLMLRNVTMINALLGPGVMMCNSTNPCTGWEFENVHVSSVSNRPSADFICAAITNSTWFNVTPTLSNCFNSSLADDAEPLQDDIELKL